MKWLPFALILVAGAVFAQPSDWAPTRNAFDPNIVARWKQVLAKDPFDAHALAKLEQLYRSFRTLDALDAELARDSNAAALITRARMHAEQRDHAGALALFTQAANLDADDARVWIAIGELERGSNSGTAGSGANRARTAYEHALADTPSPALADQALRALVELTPDPRPYQVRLLALHPNDADLWVAHGDTLLANKAAHDALDSYAIAETLLATDPRRRLEVVVRRGTAFERLGDDRAALAEFRRAILLAPKGYYLINELTARIIDAYRRHHALTDLATRLEHDWPVRMRGFTEWNTLGSLYSEISNHEQAIAALEQATRIAPWETDAQRHLIALYEQAGRNADVLVQYERAIRGAPGDIALQLEVADKTWPGNHDAAVRIARRLDQQASRDPSTTEALAKLYAKWQRNDLVRDARERLAKLEPDDSDHWLALAQAYIDNDDGNAALAAWLRVAKQQPGALARLGELFLDAGDYQHALKVLSDSIDLDSLNPLPWRLRAWAYDGIGDYGAALESAERELALTSPDRTERRVARHHIIQLLAEAKTKDSLNLDMWSTYANQWADRFAHTPPDLDAGYLLVDAFETAGCSPEDPICIDVGDVIDKLAGLVPDDPDVLASKIRAERRQGRVATAIADLGKLAAMDPTRQKYVTRQIEELRGDYGVNEYGVPDPFPDQLHRGPFESASNGHSRVHLEAALGVGGTLHGDMGSSLTLGLGGSYALLDKLALVTRVDWSQRGGIATAPNTLGASFGLMTKVLDGPSASLGLGANERVEARIGDQMDRTWDRVGIAGELASELILHDAPVGIGVRIEQWMVGGMHDTRAVIDFTVELH